VDNSDVRHALGTQKERARARHETRKKQLFGKIQLLKNGHFQGIKPTFFLHAQKRHGSHYRFSQKRLLFKFKLRDEIVMRIGYARVSRPDQSLELQLTALRGVGCCTKIFTDVASGARSTRKGLEEALSCAREGDSLVVWKLDRLGRSLRGLVNLIGDLSAREVQFISLTDGISTESATGRLFFHITAAFAEMEREIISERTKAGLDVAKKQGRIGGRKKIIESNKEEAAIKLFALDLTHKQVAKIIGVSLPTLYRSFPAEVLRRKVC